MPRSIQEILDHAEQFSDLFEDHDPNPDNFGEGESLRALSKAVQARAETEKQMVDVVSDARAEGHSWSAIGGILGTTGEAARQRYKDSDVMAVVSTLPIKRMEKAGWIDSGTDRRALAKMVRVMCPPGSNWIRAAARRSNDGSEAFTPEQVAWLLRARQLASEEQVPAAFDSHEARKLAESIVHLSVSEDETSELKQRLAEVGVRLVVVPQLPGSKIDGAAFWLDDESPVLALTLRFNRIDYLWFTLLHELAHIVCGHGNPETPMLDDEMSVESENEAEANRLAASWAMANHSGPLPGQLSGVVRLASELGIAPGIIVGRLHHLHATTGNGLPYSKHRNLLVPVNHVLVTDRS